MSPWVAVPLILGGIFASCVGTAYAVVKYTYHGRHRR